MLPKKVHETKVSERPSDGVVNFRALSDEKFAKLVRVRFQILTTPNIYSHMRKNLHTACVTNVRK